MPIPKGVLDQALSVYLEEQATARNTFLSEVAAERKTLTNGYSSADKSFDAKVEAIEKDRKNRKKDAIKTYKRDTMGEGSSYSDFSAEKDAIDKECNDQIKSAEADRERTYSQHDNNFADRLKGILEKNSKAVNKALIKLQDALPTGEE